MTYKVSKQIFNHEYLYDQFKKKGTQTKTDANQFLITYAYMIIHR